MSRALWVFGFTVSSLLGSIAWAAPLAYEGFDYPNDSSATAGLTGGFGWAPEGWIDTDNDFAKLSSDDVSLGSTAFPFPPVGDRIISLGGGAGGEGARILAAPLLDATTNGVFYASFLIRKESDGGTSSDNVEVDFGSGFGAAAQTIRFGSTSGDELFLRFGATNGGAGAFPLGETLFGVLRVTTSDTLNDVVEVNVYGASDTVPTIEPATWALSAASDQSLVFDSVRVAFGNNASGAFDELRIGATWEDVAVSESTFILGDFNMADGVTPADYRILSDNLFTGTTYEQGSIDFNGFVDLTDFAIFREIYLNAGFTINGPPAPEPAAGLMLLAGCVCAVLAPRRLILH
ncbi:MAG: hypothetical protein KDA37_04085 [Planctomycetales bacterium]|nr:hypothetical protein [Planctomycetales bacterium]